MSASSDHALFDSDDTVAVAPVVQSTVPLLPPRFTESVRFGVPVFETIPLPFTRYCCPAVKIVE
jgi:hypothetical protein